MPHPLAPPPMNPLSRLLAAIVGALALVGAFFFGVFIFIGALALGLVAWLALRLRIAWLRRKYGEVGPVPPGAYGVQGPDPRSRTGDGNDVIEAEYEVVSRKDE